MMKGMLQGGKHLQPGRRLVGLPLQLHEPPGRLLLEQAEQQVLQRVALHAQPLVVGGLLRLLMQQMTMSFHGPPWQVQWRFNSNLSRSHHLPADTLVRTRVVSVADHQQPLLHGPKMPMRPPSSVARSITPPLASRGGQGRTSLCAWCSRRAWGAAAGCAGRR